MKILQLASGDLWAGAEVQLYHLAKTLSKLKGIECIVVLLNHGQLERELQRTGITVKVLDESTLSLFQIISQLINITAQFKPDVIHTHRLKENFVGGYAAFRTKCKSVRTFHGYNEAENSFNFRVYLINFLDWFSMKFFQQKIIAVSLDLKEKLSNKYPKNKLVAINNSVDTDYILKRSQQKINVDYDNSSIKIGFVGRFVSVKRIELFYSVAKRLLSLATDRPLKFYLIGDGPLYSLIEENIKKDKLQSDIILKGFVDNSAPFIAGLDYLFFTSKNEGLPMTLLEAMFLNTLIISTNLPTIKQVLNDGEAGYFLNSDNVNELAMFILRVIKEPELIRQKKSKKAKEILLQDYSISTNIKKYTDLYKTVLD